MIVLETGTEELLARIEDGVAVLTLNLGVHGARLHHVDVLRPLALLDEHLFRGNLEKPSVV